MKEALGLIETAGMAAAIEAADVSLKSANVELIGYELTRGMGMVTVKIKGDVSAVKAALAAAELRASRVNKVYATLVIPRPGQGIDFIVNSENPNNPIHMPDSCTLDDVKDKMGSIEGKEGTEPGAGDICNLCHDPVCPRRKGQPRNMCIHYTKDGEVR